MAATAVNVEERYVMIADGDRSSTLRALRTLEAAAKPGGPHRLGEIAREAAITKPSTHRILSGLLDAGYVVTGGNGTYGPGPRAYALSAALFASQDGEAGVLRRFQAEVGQTVHVALRSADHAVYVQKVAANDGPYQMASRLGGRIPLHCTAIGKAILAHIPDDERAAVLAPGLPAHTPKTITGVAALEVELERVRANGYALDDEENEETIRCLAAPLLDSAGRAVGGVSVSTITFQLPLAELLGHAPKLREAALLLAPGYT